MRKLIPLVLLIAFAALAADQPAAKAGSLSPDEKLALRDAQISAQRAQIDVLDTATKILQANLQLADKQKVSKEAQQALGAKVTEVTERLRKATGCKDCVVTENLEFSKPPDETTPATGKKP